MVGTLVLCVLALGNGGLTPVGSPTAGVWTEYEVGGVEAGERNPFDPDQIAVEVVFAPEGAPELRVPAFWSRGGDNPGSWRVRWGTEHAGRTTYTVLAGLDGAAPSPVDRGEFSVAPGDRPGMRRIRVEPTRRRWFQRDDGKPVVLLGANACWGRLEDYKTWLDAMAAARLNCTRLWMCPFGFGIEDRPGDRLNYNQDKAALLDAVLRMAEERGIYVMLCLDFHGIFQDEPDMWGGNDFWPSHPYNVANGGPCEEQNDFFANPAARALYQKRLRYIVARWGASPAVFAWEFFNEYDNVFPKLRRPDVLQWHGDMAEHLKRADPWPRSVTTSLTGSSEDKGLWELPGLDIAQYHLYLGEKSDPAGRRIQEIVRRFRERYEKPMLFGEYGVSFRGPGREEDPFARGFRQGIWSSLLSGSAGTVLPWWWDDIHPREGWGWKTWTTLARFLEGTGVGGPEWAPVEGVKARAVGKDGTIGESMDVFALGDGKSLLAYLIHPQYHYPRNAQLMGLGPGHASVLLSFPRAMVARTVRAESWMPWMTNPELPPEVKLDLDSPEPETLLRADWLDTLKERMPGEGVAHLPCFTDDAAVRILSVPDLLQCGDDKGSERRVSSREEWEGRRTRILEGMQRVMGPLPGPEHAVPPDVQVLEETDFPAYTQRRITFAVEDWDRLPACLLIPKGIEGKAPAVLCLHPTSPLGKDVVTGRGEGTNRNYAQELAERGFVILAPDYPGFGDYGASRKELYTRGYKSATMKGIWNHMRCVDILQSLPEVDPDRIGCIGHSLGGHNTLFLAAFDPRIRAAVTSCGFTSFAKYYGGDLTGWTHDGYMPAIASEFGKDPARMPFDFPGVLAAIAPRPLFINAPVLDANFEVSGVRDCVAAALPVYGLLGADGSLLAEYPHDEHDFPAHVRKQAYGFLRKHLGP